MRHFFISLALLLVLASGPAFAANDDKVYIFKGNDDKFSNLISFPGLSKFGVSSWLAGASQSWQIRGWVNKQSNAVSFQLYVESNYSGDWAYFERAADDNANTLELKEITRDVLNCSNNLCRFNETFGITLDADYLKHRALNGFQIKVYGRSGVTFVMDITPAQIQSALLTANQFLPEERKWIAEIKKDKSEGSFEKTTKKSISQIPEPENFGPWGYGKEIIINHSMEVQNSIELSKEKLKSQGWEIRNSSDINIITEAKPIELSGKDADCGSLMGIPYLLDKRVTTMVFLSLTFQSDKVIITPAVSGTMKVGKGQFGDMGYKPLNCQLKNSNLTTQLVNSISGN